MKFIFYKLSNKFIIFLQTILIYYKNCPVGSIYTYEYSLKTARLVKNLKSG